MLPDWLFDNFLFGLWPGSWLGRNVFSAFTTSLSIGMSLAASGLFMLAERARRLGRPVPERWERGVCVALTALSFLVYYDFFNPNTRYQNYYHRHEFYHYYLGSKYFDEIGYHRLYTCTAIAEVEAGRRREIERAEIRDLGGSNLAVPMRETFVLSEPDRCKRHFTGERWQAFKADVEWFHASARGEYWDKMKLDHGYNPPPVWTMTGQLFANLAPAGDRFFKLLAALDILLQLGALLLIRWAFGRRIMTVAAVFWGCNAPASFHFTCGAFLRQDWYFLFVAALCLARKRRFALSGAALTWSAGLRIFPVVAFVGIALVMLFDVLRKRRLRSDYRRFILGSALSGALLFGASCAVTGVDAWRAFAAHIGMHKDTPLTNNMGLEMLLTASAEGRMAVTVDSRLDDDVQPWKEGYVARKHARRPLQIAISALVLGWMAWALSRVKLVWLGMALSLPLMMSLLNLTCYYYCYFVAGAALVLWCPALAPAYLALAAASQVLATRFYWFDDQHVALSVLFYSFALSTLYAVSRPITRLAWSARPSGRTSRSLAPFLRRRR